MKKHIFLICQFFILNISLLAQNNDFIIVKAGTKLIDYVPVSERYMYSDFTMGRILLKNGNHSVRNLNYNYLAGEIEFIQNRDTLVIANKKDLKSIIVATDTFYYDKGYIQQLSSGKIKTGLKQFMEIKEIQNKDSYGVSGSGSATTSYGSIPADGMVYKLAANKAIVFKRTLIYYILRSEGGFVVFTRKSAMQLFPERKDEIKAYIKSNKVNFNSREDLLEFAEFLNTLE